MNSIKYISMGANISEVKKFMTDFCHQFDKTYNKYFKTLKLIDEDEVYVYGIFEIKGKELKRVKKSLNEFVKILKYRMNLICFNDIMAINKYVDFENEFENMLKRYNYIKMRGSGYSQDDMEKMLNELNENFEKALESAKKTSQSYQGTQYYKRIDYFLSEISDEKYLIVSKVREYMTDSIKKSLYWDFDVKKAKIMYWISQLEDCENTIIEQAKHDIDNNTVEKIMLRKKRLLKLYDTIMAE